jgi:hypothetical protein
MAALAAMAAKAKQAEAVEPAVGVEPAAPGVTAAMAAGPSCFQRAVSCGWILPGA